MARKQRRTSFNPRSVQREVEKEELAKEDVVAGLCQEWLETLGFDFTVKNPIVYIHNKKILSDRVVIYTRAAVVFPVLSYLNENPEVYFRARAILDTPSSTLRKLRAGLGLPLR